MRITEPNVSRWELRPQGAAHEQRVAREHEPRSATIASQLDQNPRDGWIDDDDLPYDEIELLQRARAAQAARSARRELPSEQLVADPAEPLAARIDVTRPDTAQPRPLVDLFA